MELNLHANATTTPKTRGYIQRSRKSVVQLAAELGVSETTIRRWRGRTTVADRSHQPRNLTTSLSAVEERAVCELRTSLQLPLDDIVEVMQRCINAKLSRSAIHRCLQRNGISRRPKPDKPKAGVFETASVGFIHIDLKHLPALQRRTSYAFVAIDRATRYVYVEIHSRRDSETAAGFLQRFLAHFPHDVHTILTDNGAEFTDRFAVDKKNKPPGRPSGSHPFDRLCKQHGIDHRLTKPYHPQTNGLVERFNRRIAEAIGREEKRGSARRTFADHADRDAFLGKFVHDYNRTRLKCLGYKAPIQALTNLPGPNTFAGTTMHLSAPAGDDHFVYVSFTMVWRYHYVMTSPPIRQPVRIIGIDPGLRRTGWGVIETEGNRLVFIGCGSVEPPDHLPLASRLLAIHEGLAAVLGDFRPAEAAVEQTFVNKDGVATLKLGQARGVAMLAPAMFGIEVAEYAPNQVKKTVVGAGHADKNQIAVMLKILLPKAEPKSADAADALAIAITHAHHRASTALRLKVANL